MGTLYVAVEARSGYLSYPRRVGRGKSVKLKEWKITNICLGLEMNLLLRTRGAQGPSLRAKTTPRLASMDSMQSNLVGQPSQLPEKQTRGPGCTDYYHLLSMTPSSHTLSNI